MGLYRVFFLLILLLIGCPQTTLGVQKGKKKVVEIYVPEPDPLAVKARPHRIVAAIKEAPDPNSFHIQSREGIDVSHYQGRIDWQKVAKETQISYAYMKATEGASLVDDTYARNMREARKVGLKVGSYHFYRANVSVEEQIANMTSTVKAEQQDLLPLIDVEVKPKRISDQKFIADLKRFLDAITKHYGRKPIIYTFYNFYNKHLVGQLHGYQWMIARYSETEPVLSDGLSYSMWQYTSSGVIPGIAGDVDRSVIMDNYSLSEILF